MQIATVKAQNIKNEKSSKSYEYVNIDKIIRIVLALRIILSLLTYA